MPGTRKLNSILKYLWASPNTLLGLLFVINGKVKLVDGIVEIHGPLARFALNHLGPCKGASAMTLGHVVIGQDQHCLDFSRSHERIHVRQYETFGPFFIPLYFWASFHAWRTGQDYYRDNFFEVEAYSRDRTG
jgi:hypothetical protein